MTDWRHGQNHPIAVALTWDGISTPRVTAKGRDETAERILAAAREHDVPLYEDGKLAERLAQFELDQEIPRELFLVIAHIIAFAYYVAGRTSVLKMQGE